MTEAYRLLRLLGRRVSATTFYEAGEPLCGEGHIPCLFIHLADADILVFIDEDPEGRVRTALSFLAMHGLQATVHLNRWRRPLHEQDMPALVTDLWGAFWVHELENRQIGRTQWMHGPNLPPLQEDVVPESPLDALLASVEEGRPPERSFKKLLIDIDDLDLLGL